MIERIVRMSFLPEKVADFVDVFNASKQAISSFEGCSGLKLLKDVNAGNVYFTYSNWRDEAALNAYRNSDLFKDTWAKTKILFNEKPMAWSTRIDDLVK